MRFLLVALLCALSYAQTEGVTDETTSTVQRYAPGAQALRLFNAIKTRRIKGNQCPNKDFAPNPNPLHWNCRAGEVAQNHAQDMYENNYFSHDSQDTKSPWDRCEMKDIVCGSELLFKTGLSWTKAIDAWVQSSTHCEVLFDWDLIAVGIGMFEGLWVLLTVHEIETDCLVGWTPPEAIQSTITPYSGPNQVSEETLKGINQKCGILQGQESIQECQVGLVCKRIPRSAAFETCQDAKAVCPDAPGFCTHLPPLGCKNEPCCIYGSDTQGTPQCMDVTNFEADATQFADPVISILTVECDEILDEVSCKRYSECAWLHVKSECDTIIEAYDAQSDIQCDTITDAATCKKYPNCGWIEIEKECDTLAEVYDAQCDRISDELTCKTYSACRWVQAEGECELQELYDAIVLQNSDTMERINLFFPGMLLGVLIGVAYKYK